MVLQQLDERGVTAIEYALVASLVTVAIATAFLAISGQLTVLLGNICAAIGTTC